MRRRQVLGSAAAAVLATAVSSPAYAEEQWCDVDPARVLTNKEGSIRAVFISIFGPVSHVDQLFNPTMSDRVNGGRNQSEALVHLDVTVDVTDGHLHPIVSEVWTGFARQGERLSRVEGTTGKPHRHRFRLDFP